jgi:3-methyladenine DNA glycosylase Tag
MPNKIIRCPWGDTGDALMREYRFLQSVGVVNDHINDCAFKNGGN